MNECMQMTLMVMFLSVTVNPGAKQTGLVEYDQWTKSLKIIEEHKVILVHAIAEILQIPTEDLQIVSGLKSRKKVIRWRVKSNDGAKNGRSKSVVALGNYELRFSNAGQAIGEARRKIDYTTGQ